MLCSESVWVSTLPSIRHSTHTQSGTVGTALWAGDTDCLDHAQTTWTLDHIVTFPTQAID